MGGQQDAISTSSAGAGGAGGGMRLIMLGAGMPEGIGMMEPAQ